MQILHLALTPLVGAPLRICQALNMHKGIQARFAVLETVVGAYGQMMFDNDLQWRTDRDEIIALARTADVIHLHNYLDLDSTQFEPINLRQLWQEGRPMVRHFHSAPQAVAQHMHASEQAISACPIPKLVIAQFHARYYPSAKLVPNIVFGDSHARPQNQTADTLRIAYAPTRFNSGRASRWDTKGYRETIKLLNSVKRKAAARHIALQVDVIEQVSHAECLQRKSACHIVIDDLVTGSYHLNTLESLASGSVCLTYMDRATQQAVFDLTGRSDFPAVSVSLEDAEAVLLDLVANGPLVAALGDHSRQWMQKHWAPKAMARHFLDAYDHVIAHPGQAFTSRYDCAPSVAEWANVRLNDLLWANRQQRWPWVMPDWMRDLRGGIGMALRSIGLKP